MGQSQQCDHAPTGCALIEGLEQRVEGAAEGVAREQLIAVDEVQQRHRLAAQGMDEMVIVDHVATAPIAAGTTSRRVGHDHHRRCPRRRRAADYGRATWYYPRLFGGHPLPGEPEYWSDEWWEMYRFSLQEHERLGMVAWTTDWSGVSGPTRPAEVFPNKLRAQRSQEPWLWGRRLAMHRREAAAPGPLAIQLGERENLLWAAAFRNDSHGLDERSRHDLAAEGRTIAWQAPEAGWTLTAVVSQPHDLDYLDRRVAERWIELLLVPYEQRLAATSARRCRPTAPTNW